MSWGVGPGRCLKMWQCAKKECGTGALFME
jgi:hypothetical protein